MNLCAFVKEVLKSKMGQVHTGFQDSLAESTVDKKNMDDQRKSLSSAVPIPNWMKSKMNNRFDLDQSAFSPTEMDDTFMYVSRVKANNANPGPSDSLGQNQSLTSVTAPFVQNMQQQDLSKHTAPCRRFLQGVEGNGAQKIVIASSSKKLKSCGVDDGFKGEAAKCGSSILRVAHQMVTGRVMRGFTVEDDNYDPIAEGFIPAKRRGSKSLPASPVGSPSTSPKLRRRNRFFTPPFVDPETGKEKWALATLLGRRDISQSLDVIAEKQDEAMTKGASNINITDSQRPSETKTRLVPRPSELREMNFWSPTSM